ncbi:MAG: type IV pilin protein [Planctomycetota bacterium]|jgi:hypothetical protein
MHRYVFACLLIVSIAACGDLTRVPPPPVPLSALEGPRPVAAADQLIGTSAQTVRLVRAIPAQALCTLHLPDIGGSIRDFKQTGLYKWLSSPEVQEQLGLTADFGFNLKLPGLGTGGGDSGMIDAARLLDSLKGEFILAVEDVRVQQGQDFPDVRLLGGITVRGAEREAEQMLELVDMLAANQPGVHVEKGTAGGYGFSRIVGKTPRPWVVELALYDQALLAGFGRETVTRMLNRLENPEELSLADSASFRECMERCGDPRDAVRFHVDLATIWSRYGKYLPKEARRVLRNLKLDELRSLSMAIRFEGKDIAITTLLDSPGGKDIVTQLLAAHTVDRQFLDRVPANANSFSIFALDGVKILRTLREVLPETMLKEFEATLEDLREDGIDLETDVFEVFGPRCAIVNVPTGRPEGSGLDLIWNQLLGTSFIFEVQDPLRAEHILKRLPKRTSYARRRDLVLDGVRASAYEFEREGVPGDFAICYALVDSYFVVTPTERTLRRMLRSRSPETGRRLREALKEVPETAVIVSYDEMRQGFMIQLDAFVRGFARTTGGSEPPRSTQPLRGLHGLGPAIAYTVADNRGVFSFTRSPTGGLGSVGGLSGLAVVAAIAVPSLHSSRLRANEAAAIASLRAIHAAQETFRANVLRDADHDGEGEYAFLGELLGQRRPGETRIRNREPLVSGSWVKQKGEFVRSGYQFRIYLPAEDGSPIGEQADLASIRRVDGDLAETVMVAVAWPVSKGITGHQAFYLDASGRLLACSNGPYGRDRAPASDVLSSQKGNLASRPLRQGEPTRDGCSWERLK